MGTVGAGLISMTATQVLVVDDDVVVRQTIADALRLGGYDAIEARDGAQAIELATRNHYGLVILDVNMPHVDGFTVLEKLRRRKPDLPIIMLTARDEREDAVRGFKLGADDYIRKPFGLEEFSLRVAAVLRRTQSPVTSSTLQCGDVELNPDTAQVRHRGAEVVLSPTEFRLLQYLMANQGQVLSKTNLLESVWGIDYDTASSVVETYVSYLRKKLDDDSHEHIVTVRGFGIKFVSLT
jgi:two-component system OmpR family response regulator